MNGKIDVDDDTTYMDIYPPPHPPAGFSLCPEWRRQPPPGKERWNAKYRCPREIHYWSKRYKKASTVAKDYPSDGATHAMDINSISWWQHDVLKDHEKWDDGTPCTNRQASMVLYDILAKEGRWFRRWTWPPATFLFGEASRLFRAALKSFQRK